MWSLLTQSANTLDSLSLPIPTCLEANYPCLWNMHFPLLHSLTLGHWQYDSATAEDHDFTDFIIAHSPTLETLDMEYCNYDRHALEFESSSLPRLHRNSLPRLRSFRGNAQSLKIMAQARMKSLSTSLQRLVVGPGGVDSPTYEVEWMLDALLSRSRSSSGRALSQPLGALKELDFDISQWEEREREDAFEAIRRFALCCSASLEIWRRALPFSIGPIDASELGGLFGLFSKLRVLYVFSDTIRSRTAASDDNGDAEYMKKLAVYCPALQEVCVTEDWATPQKYTWWDVVRLEADSALDSDLEKTTLTIIKRLAP